MIITNDKYCVYAHINKINGKIYIGQTCQDLNRRWRNGEGYKACTAFYRAIQKYSWDSFEHEIIASNLTLKEANRFEELLIEKLDTTNPDKGYNLRSGGENYLCSEETKQRMSQNHANFKGQNSPLYGKPLSEEHKKKVSEARKGKYKGKNNPNYGKRLSDEAKAKLRESHKNISMETRQKLSDALKGRILTEEHKKNISKGITGEKNPFYGKHHTKETKRKLLEAQKSRKQILCVETNVLYPSMREAERQTNISRQNIYSSLKTKGTAGGYHWRYADEINFEVDKQTN